MGCERPFGTGLENEHPSTRTSRTPGPCRRRARTCASAPRSAVSRPPRSSRPRPGPRVPAHGQARGRLCRPAPETSLHACGHDWCLKPPLRLKRRGQRRTSPEPLSSALLSLCLLSPHPANAPETAGMSTPRALRDAGRDGGSRP